MNKSLRSFGAIPFRLFSVSILIIAQSFTANLFSQHITASYFSTTPEASLFFLNPRYLSPAFGSGALGMINNPAGLCQMNGRQFSMAYAASTTSTGEFNIDLVDESEIYQTITLNSQVAITESGGLSGIGYAQQFGRWRIGLGLLQARQGGIDVKASGEVDAQTTFDFDKSLTREIVRDLPVDELPITWNVDTQAELNFSLSPTKLSLSILPVMGGLSFSSQHFSLGAGLIYYRLSSSHQTGILSSEFSTNTTIVGTPTGNDPISGLPWSGSINAELDIRDNPLSATYHFDVSGHRFALMFGGLMNTKLLSIGASYSYGFKGSIRGNYDITTVTTTGYPQENLFTDARIDMSVSPQVSGNVDLTMHEFTKDTLSSSDGGELKLGGYHSLSVGLHFLILGVFAGTEIPRSYPDLMTAHFGVYADFPLPRLPVRLNFGYIQWIDAISNDLNTSTPFRVVSHVGGGIAVRSQMCKLLPKPIWIRLGVRSSLTSYAMNIFEKKSKNTKTSKSPSPLENLAFSMGIDVPF